MYPLIFGSQTIPVYCHVGNFGCGDGGWTLTMKIDGIKVQIMVLNYKRCGKLSNLNLCFLFDFRELFITTLTFGETEIAIILQEARLGLISKRLSYRPTGRYPSPRSVLV